MMSHVCIFGATSGIAQATAQQLAAKGTNLYLVGRNEERTKALAEDLRLRHKVQVEYKCADLADVDQHEALLQEIDAQWLELDAVLVAYGILGDKDCVKTDPTCALEVLNTNCTSTIALLTRLGKDFANRQRGVIAVISSVAGDRGRRSNYVYGASKGGLQTFLQGFRAEMHSHNVAVVDIRPGFVDTAMTANMKKGPLFAQPEAVAKGIINAMERHKHVVYLPWFWRWILLVVRNVPESVAKRMKW